MAEVSLSQSGNDMGELSENEVSSTMVNTNQVVVQIPDSISDLKDTSGAAVTLSVTDGLISSTAPTLLGSTDNTTLQGLLSHPVTMSGAQLIGQPEAIQIIAVANPEFMTAAGGDSSNRVWQIVPGTSPEIATIVAVQESEYENQEVQQEENCSNEVSSMVSSESLPPIIIPHTPAVHQLPPKCPAWAARLKCCEQIGDSFRGYVESEVELDLLLTYHKQQTQSFWGTRQSPSQSRLSTRLMWKSQYVPFDGIPFINTGSRAVVMECQYGPRRKGSQSKKDSSTQPTLPSSESLDFNEEYDNPATGQSFRKTCPARIYIKKVKKFLQFAVDPNSEKKHLKAAMDKSFQALRGRLLEAVGQERFYVQLPTEKAHEFHNPGNRENTESRGTNRLHPQVAAKIRELVSAGETRLYAIRKALRTFVSKVLCSGTELPERHDLTYFPTVNDLKNHIHLAMVDIENGSLPLTAQTVNLEVLLPKRENANDEEVTEIKQVDNTLWAGQPSAEGDGPTPETVTVTLTQQPGEEGHHIVSRIETHLSDGTTQISNTLTPETAQLLANIHPSVFPGGCESVIRVNTNLSKGVGTTDTTTSASEISNIVEPCENIPLVPMEITADGGVIRVEQNPDEPDEDAHISSDNTINQLATEVPGTSL